MNHTVITYITYLLLSIPLTIWVAKTLFKNGRVFLVDCFRGNEPLADSVNHMLVVGFYLINIGFVTLFLKITTSVESMRGVFEALSGKVGTVLIVLGIMHFFNLLVFAKVRKRATLKNVPPPVAPDAVVTPPLAL